MADRKKITDKIQIAILAFFIVFMPLGSWYYLQSGFNYHEKLMSELREYGELPPFHLLTQNDDTLVNDDFRGKIMIASFYAENTPTSSTSMDYARRILRQFKSQKDLLFLFHNINPEIQDARLLEAMAEKEELTDKRAYFLSGDKDQLTQLFTLGYKIPLMEERTDGDSITFKTDIATLPDLYPYFVLVDSSLMIRNYYDINDEASVKSLVEHLAIILPREKKSKAVHRPQKEK
jgi:protein SCO1/2